MLNPRAIALQGIGFSPRATIDMGFFDIDIVIEPIPNVGGSGGGYAERPPEEKVKLTITTTIRGNKYVKHYVVTEVAGMQLMKQVKMIKRAQQKMSVSVGKVTSMLQKAKHAVTSINIPTMRKKPK
jgi:hypothetical protein